jgi:hypothetical protein
MHKHETNNALCLTARLSPRSKTLRACRYGCDIFQFLPLVDVDENHKFMLTVYKFGVSYLCHDLRLFL